MSHPKPDPIDAALAKWLASVPLRVCVAYSGGIDSSVLLHACSRGREHAPALELSAIHIHHGLSENADHWAAHCEASCRALLLPFRIVRVAVNDRAALGVEAAARRARYDALREHASAHEGVHIALAHHARDQAETVLLQLLRGAGPAGLAAMPEHAPPFARPLLHVEKAAIDRYASAHEIAHIVDESNDDERFARNRLRRRVWPVLTDAFASAERTLSRAAGLQFEADQLASDLAQIDFASCAENDTLVASKWRTLSSPRRRNALRFWLAARNVVAPSAQRLAEWEKQLLTANPTQNLILTHASIEGSIRLYRDRICFVKPGFVSLEQMRPGIQWTGESEVQFGVGIVRFVAANSQNYNPNLERLRPFILGNSWKIRTRREKDKIVLSPNSGGLSMKNVFQDANVPPWLRNEWPILTCNGEIAAIPGVAISQTFQAKEDEAGFLLSWEIVGPQSSVSPTAS
jgi:tRNA(Ile)-lysidine synthase